MSVIAGSLGVRVARSKAGRNLLILCMAAVLAVPVVLVALPVSIIFAMGSNSVHVFGGACIGTAPTVTGN